MDYEKKYKEAAKAVESLLFDAQIRHSKSVSVNALADIFLELKESEDERTRKELLLDIPKVFPHDKAFRYIAYLEKQGEQKPSEYSEWSEEDEMMIKFTLTYFRKAGATEDSDIIKWLKSLKERLQSQHKLSDEDYNEIETIACHLDNINNEGMAKVLRSIRDKYCSYSYGR